MSKKIIKSDIDKCKTICKALKLKDYNMAFSNAKLHSDIWVLPTDEVNERLVYNIQYDTENGTNSGFKLAKNLCELLQSELDKLEE